MLKQTTRLEGIGVEMNVLKFGKTVSGHEMTVNKSYIDVDADNEQWSQSRSGDLNHDTHGSPQGTPPIPPTLSAGELSPGELSAGNNLDTNGASPKSPQLEVPKSPPHNHHGRRSTQ